MLRAAPTRPRRGVSALVALVLVVAGLAIAPSAASAAPGAGVPNGIYSTQQWVEPGETVEIVTTWTNQCGTWAFPQSYTEQWRFDSTDGSVPLADPAWSGESQWFQWRALALRDASGNALPVGRASPEAGYLVLTCTPTGGGTPTTLRFPLTVSVTAPASIYHSSTAWTWLTSPAGQAITVNALGFTAGEQVTVNVENRTRGDVATAITAAADGGGAVTGTVVRPAHWRDGDDIAILAAGASSRYLLIASNGRTLVDPSLTLEQSAGSTSSAYPGGAATAEASGYQAGETVVVALHRAVGSPIQLGTLTADATGRVSGTVPIPASVPLGDYRLWVGAKTVGYLLQNAPFRVSPLPAVDRLAGSDRFATSAAISGRTPPFAPGTGTVYLASGMNFPDALSAGALAAQVGAPVLLTQQDSLTPSARAELMRLQPARIVVAGGTPSVSAAAFASVRDLPYTHATDRIAGADRVETNRLMIQDALETATRAYIATGWNFPDALAAAPAAAAEGGAVVLVNGAASAVDTTTLEMLTSLGVTDIALVGGTDRVTAAIERQLAALYPGHVERIAGADRFETAALIVNSVWPDGADEAILASGLKFPDALSASALGVPLLTSAPTCIPATAAAAIGGLELDRLTLVGDASSLSASVAALLRC